MIRSHADRQVAVESTGREFYPLSVPPDYVITISM